MMGIFKRNSRRQAPLRSYAQSGEDILAHNVLCRHMRIEQPTYVDIGAHDPVRLSNTYLLYTLGSRGLLIEPDPDFVKKLRRRRKRDAILAAGISAAGVSEAPFYRLNQPTLNTFSLRDAEDACAQGPYRIVERLSVPVLPIAEAIDRHAQGRPNFVSIDAEGLDVTILNTYDFDRHAPELICVESAEFCENNVGALRREVFDLLVERGYFLYASTYLNGLFVRRQAWRERVGEPPAQTLRPTADTRNHHAAVAA
jgi:FkbM family methyltransferase